MFDPSSEAGRGSIRRALREGRTPDQIALKGRSRDRAIFLAAIEEEARLEGEFNTMPATPATVVKLRDQRQLRWERIAVRIFGDPNRRDDTKSLYDRARGPGASKRSYTGQGRRFPDMDG